MSVYFISSINLFLLLLSIAQYHAHVQWAITLQERFNANPFLLLSSILFLQRQCVCDNIPLHIQHLFIVLDDQTSQHIRVSVDMS